MCTGVSVRHLLNAGFGIKRFLLGAARAGDRGFRSELSGLHAASGSGQDGSMGGHFLRSTSDDEDDLCGESAVYLDRR